MTRNILWPAEFDKHRGTIICYPFRVGSWGIDSTEARKAFCAIIKAISEDEKIYVCCKDADVLKMASEDLGDVNDNVRLEIISSDDSWARDIGPTFIKLNGELTGIDWGFNAWGGDFDGLYAEWDKDAEFAKEFCYLNNYDRMNMRHFILEGGSIHTDGEGTVITTEACLLSGGRNPELTKCEIENVLKNALGAEKVLWLPRGIYNDETNEHVDNVCAYISPAEVVLAWTDDENDPQYAMSKACLDYLESVTDAKGRKITVHKIPIPSVPVTIDESDVNNIIADEGEDARETGERLAASYVNFYFTNNSVIVPSFGGDNAESDKRAADILSSICKNRKIVQIPAISIIKGGGNIHCITQQIPQ